MEAPPDTQELDLEEEPTEDLETTEELEQTEENIDELALESMDDTEHEEKELAEGLVEFFVDNDDTNLTDFINEANEDTFKFLVNDDRFMEEIARAINDKWKAEMKSFGDKIKMANIRLHYFEDLNVETLLATGEIKNKSKNKFLLARQAVQKIVHALVKVARPAIDKSADPEDEFFR